MEMRHGMGDLLREGSALIGDWKVIGLYSDRRVNAKYVIPGMNLER